MVKTKIELQHLFFFFLETGSQSSPGRPQIHRNPPASPASRAGLQVWYLIRVNTLLNTRAGVSLLGHWCQCWVNKWLEQDSGSVTVNVITKTGTQGLESGWVEIHWTRGSPEPGRKKVGQWCCDATMHLRRTPTYNYKLLAFNISHLIFLAILGNKTQGKRTTSKKGLLCSVLHVCLFWDFTVSGSCIKKTCWLIK